MDYRLKSLIATILVHVGLGFLLVIGLAVSIPQRANDKMTLINIAPDRAPPPPSQPPSPQSQSSAPKAPAAPAETEYATDPNIPPSWASLSPFGRILAVVKYQKQVVDFVTEEDRRLAQWREAMPQGTGPGKVTRLRPPNLTTHTLYWPALWSQGPLPIIAWGSGFNDICSNNSLPYAGFLGEIASHGYFIIAVGNDDIDFYLPNKQVTPDGRPIRSQASALKKGVDWAIAENSRAGSPYRGKLDTSKIAYMGHACGGQQAMTASSDPRTTTTVLLNSPARIGSGSPTTPVAHFDGWEDDDGVIGAGDANFARANAAGWPLYRATLTGTGKDVPYRGPDLRWTKAVLAWLNWQLKGDPNGSTTFQNCYWNCPKRDGWQIQVTGL